MEGENPLKTFCPSDHVASMREAHCKNELAEFVPTYQAREKRATKGASNVMASRSEVPGVCPASL